MCCFCASPDGSAAFCHKSPRVVEGGVGDVVLIPGASALDCLLSVCSLGCAALLLKSLQSHYVVATYTIQS